MAEELLDFGNLPNFSSLIKVIGVGGGGGNAVNYMMQKGIADVDFVLCNTDAQALENSSVPVKIQLGASLTEGRGAGNSPAKGEQAAIENYEDIVSVLDGPTRMVFLTACMGGGTGTGAAPVIAKLARELGVLTIAVVTVPSQQEGRLRYQQAMNGVEQLKQHVDSILVINNEKIREVYGDLPAREAFAKADEILATAVKGVAEIITLHGNINIDFADVVTVMKTSGSFIMGTAYADGEKRAEIAVENALHSPLLDSNDIVGTDNILLNIVSGEQEVTMGEIGFIIEHLQNLAGSEANIIWGNGRDENLTNEICVTIIATGFNAAEKKEEKKKPIVVELDIEEQNANEASTEGVVIDENEQLVNNESNPAKNKVEPTVERTKDAESRKTKTKPGLNTSRKAKPKKFEKIIKQFELFFNEGDDEFKDE